MEENAQWLYGTLIAPPHEWTLNAICGLLGNAQTESTINPGIWQNLKENVGPGYGLTQWTPFTKYTNWCMENNLVPGMMESAVARLKWELDNGEQWVVHKNYPLTFQQFVKSTASPYYLAMTFLNNYEMPKVINQPKRGTQAEQWYQFLSGETPPTPGPGEGGTDRNVYTSGKAILPAILKRRRMRNG